MESSNDDELSNTSFHKKRKILRACDNCRRRKKRCGGPVPPHAKCCICLAQNVECTYGVEPKPGYLDGYIEGLERRIQMLEGLLKKLCPDQAVLHSLIAPLDPEYATYLTTRPVSSSISTISPLPSSSATALTPEAASKSSVLDVIHKIAALSLSSHDDASRDDDLEQDDLSEQWKLLSTDKSEDKRFWGKSSAAMFMQTAMSFKNQNSKGAQIKRRILQNRRPIFWERLPWYKDLAPSVPNYIFPPPGLIKELTDAYFEHVNLLYPLLHRPTFERGVESNLHERDAGFGSVLLLVCAVGSRYTETIDKRTLVDGVDSPYSAGWKWYNQVHVVKPSLVDPPTLYDMQLYGLAVQFLTGTCAPQTVWNLVGFGIRLAQDVGIHRRRLSRERLTVEDELWKRAFWVLIAVDRTISMGIGRPCAIFDDHFDLDMPIECDDEYWEHPDPTQRFKQPEGVPSAVAAFNHHLRLSKIMAFAMITIYSIKTKLWEYMSQEWEQHIVTELDSALNNWVNSLPEYLRWDPNRTDDRFFKLSGSLITFYYYVQILVHRPSNRTKSQPSPLAYPSLAICTSAARSCALVLEQQMKRFVAVYPYMQLSAVTAVMVLLLNSWAGTRGGVVPDPIVMSQVGVCIGVLGRAEERWWTAGAVMDILNEVTRAGEDDDSGSLGKISKTDLRSDAPSVSQLSLFSFGVSSTGALPIQVPDNLYESSIPEIGQSESEQLAAIFDGGFQYNDSISSIVGHVEPFDPFTQITIPDNVAISSLFESDSDQANLNAAASGIGEEQVSLDGDTMDMWINAPNGFELDEWDSFFANFA
ncbi:fungal-specific transcription factor domain-containing protein [Cyathus striatus]|nr:fungal-specific transcription factor domain-containing protein [Cyathus striatus]